ncbi:MAG: glycoside hydrolase family 2 protein [Pirellulaceae bacterium]
MRYLNTIVRTTLILIALGNHAQGADWKPAQGPLATRWTQEVTPDNAWREYPRPQLVRKEWTNLNGLWQYAITEGAAEQPHSFSGEILVPFPIESALSGVMKPVNPQHRLWYQRSFDAPAIEGRRLLLHFGAVDWQCTVWVNGQQVAEHTGGYDPFTIDITSAVKQGTNDLVVAVRDPTDTHYQPRGKQVLQPQGIMYTAVTGIWQTVWLEVVPRDYIESLKLVPDVDRQQLTVTVHALTPHASVELGVTIKVLDAGNVCQAASGKAGQPVLLKIPEAKLWSPDSPHLYDLQIELTADGQAVDHVESYFGMRKIEVRKDEDGINRLMLNNRVLFQYGPLDQGWWPDGLYTPPTDAAIQYDIEMTKKYGMNMARKHVKYECARWYYWCDRLGLLVWQDMPSGDAQRNADSKANYRRELQAMVDALHNAPCIVMWVPFNEGWGQHDTAEVVQWMEQYDPTRPINEASGWTDMGSGTVSDMHSYPGPGMRPVEEKRVVVLGEFGGLGMPVAGHTWQAQKNWGYVSYENAQQLTDAYVDLLTRMRPLIGQGLSAAVYTQTTDVEIEVNGLMTYDREVNKIELERAAEAARKLYLPPPKVKILVPTSQAEPQSWRFTLQQPADDWIEAGFADAGWQTAPGGFGTSGTPGAIVGTNWASPDIWLRRTFTLDKVPTDGDLSLLIHHDEDAEVYINGQLAAKLGGYSTTYTAVPLSAEATRAFQAGENTIAVHCHQTRGGQYIDAGIALLIERSE